MLRGENSDFISLYWSKIQKRVEVNPEITNLPLKFFFWATKCDTSATGRVNLSNYQLEKQLTRKKSKFREQALLRLSGKEETARKQQTGSGEFKLLYLFPLSQHIVPCRERDAGPLITDERWATMPKSSWAGEFLQIPRRRQSVGGKKSPSSSRADVPAFFSFMYLFPSFSPNKRETFWTTHPHMKHVVIIRLMCKFTFCYVWKWNMERRSLCELCSSKKPLSLF